MNRGEFYYFIERLMSVPLILAGLPFMIIFSCVSVIQFRNNPIYSQYRGLSLSTGLFKIYKIRTISASAGQVKCSRILYKDELSEYLTPFWNWLRRTGLDELPQLINVLRGEMSLVGPRPLSINDLILMKQNYPDYYTAREKLKIRPGITGHWQVNGKRERGITELIEMDIFYSKNFNLKLDFKIILRTIFVSFTARNSGAIPQKKYYTMVHDRGS